MNFASFPSSCDIFCNVIDNYGDIGVSWRLARQLANEFGLNVRLWVDDLGSFAKLCSEVDRKLAKQFCRGVEVCRWDAEFSDVQPAELVIDAFGCALPEVYLLAMTVSSSPPAWINLEYLSAEDWVAGCHRLPSPHPRLPLTRYFFFPGFTARTGGLLLEHDLLSRRDAFMADFSCQTAFWRSIGMNSPYAGTWIVSMFAYENGALEFLFDLWVKGEQSVLCLVPEGRILPQVGRYFGDVNPEPGNEYVRGSLRVRVLPFVDQERYDELLWACDLNFVRGEDSCVRAQWAGKPFVWQIYPQHDAVHQQKLQAFLDIYNASLDAGVAQSMQQFWHAWNSESVSADLVAASWDAFIDQCGELEIHAQTWARDLSANNLALNLLDFSNEIGTMRAFKIEGQ